MRPRSLAYALLLLGGALAVVAGAQPWWRATGEGIAVRFSGTQVTGGLCQALAVVVLVGTVLLLALRVRGRRVLGSLLTVVGASVAVVGALRSQPSAEAVRTQVRTVSLADQFALEPSVWPWVYLVAGLAAAAGGATTLLTAARWPGRADRYARPAARRRPPAESSDPADVWRALDAGVDPTDTDPTDTDVDGTPKVTERSRPHPGGADVRKPS